MYHSMPLWPTRISVLCYFSFGPPIRVLFQSHPKNNMVRYTRIFILPSCPPSTSFEYVLERQQTVRHKARGLWEWLCPPRDMHPIRLQISYKNLLYFCDFVFIWVCVNHHSTSFECTVGGSSWVKPILSFYTFWNTRSSHVPRAFIRGRIIIRSLHTQHHLSRVPSHKITPRQLERQPHIRCLSAWKQPTIKCI